MAFFCVSAFALCAAGVVTVASSSAVASGSTNFPAGKECPANPTPAFVPEHDISMLQIMQKHISGASRLATNRTNPPGTLANLGDLAVPFHLFTAQCSHNTYALGNQVYSSNPLVNPSASKSVSAASMSLAMRLGYRCIELDVWPRRDKKPWASVTGGAWEGPRGAPNMDFSRMKVTHRGEGTVPGTFGTLGGGKDTLNNVDLTLFIKDLLEWLEADEIPPASADQPKLPLIISIENHAAGLEDEGYLLEKFKWLNLNSRTGDEAIRIVPPAEFKVDTTMQELAATGGVRKIILKGGVTEGSDFAGIIAMKKVGSPGGAYTSKSEPMPAKTAKLTKLVKEKILVRTYPSGLSMRSQNYNPATIFATGVQMVCLNLQGDCKDSSKVCMSTSRGQCQCGREFSASLETMFARLGYDGYINYKEKSPAIVSAAVSADADAAAVSARSF